MASGFFDLWGTKVRSASTRRYVVYARTSPRPKQTGVANGRITYAGELVWSRPFIEYRSDNLDVAKRKARISGMPAHVWQTAVIDTQSGQVVMRWPDVVVGSARARRPHPRTRAERLATTKRVSKRRATRVAWTGRAR